MLCQACQQFITKCLTATEPQKRNDREEVVYPYYHENKQSLEDSMALKCLICCLFTHWPNHPFGGTTNFGCSSSISHFINFYGDYKSPWCYSVQLHELDNETATLSAAAISSSSTGSLATLSLAKHWLDTCTRTHTKCGLGSCSNWYPTRLLDLSQERIRLIETATEIPSGLYATLSHCWGVEQIPVMNSDNHDIFVTTGRLLSEFPTSHAEAIRAAKMLKFRYLWIDCYCIMQAGNSASFASDKARELTLMKLVYANSALNIGATSASGASSGCFVERDASTLCPERFTLRQPGTGEAHIYQIEITGSTLDHDLYDEHKLFTRGWVLQGRLLAPRMLHFAGTHVYWECSEVGLASDKLPFDNRPVGAAGGPPFNMESNATEESDPQPGAWESIIMAYSELKLSCTFEDKFVALSGIAEHMADILNDQYIAGVFKGRLLSQLCWYRLAGSQRARRWRAPSWSWACINGSVGNHSIQLEEALAEYVSSDIHLLDPSNPFGRLESASLTLNGRMLEGRNGNRSQEKQVIEVGSVQLTVREWPLNNNGSSFDGGDLSAGPSGSTSYLLPLAWCANRSGLSSHLTVEEALTVSKEKQQQQSFEMRGLLLVRLDAETFQRCGQFHAYDDENPLELLRMWASVSPTEVTIV